MADRRVATVQCGERRGIQLPRAAFAGDLGGASPRGSTPDFAKVAVGFPMTYSGEQRAMQDQLVPPRSRRSSGRARAAATTAPRSRTPLVEASCSVHVIRPFAR